MNETSNREVNIKSHIYININLQFSLTNIEIEGVVQVVQF
jgi:hypothetical protein